MNQLSPEAIEQLFTKARTHSAWLSKPVNDDVLHKLYDLLKWGPTSANSSPARFVFVKSAGAKAKLLECMDAGNVEKTKTAPVTAIVALDAKFYENLLKLFPHMDLRGVFRSNAPLAEAAAFRNSSLQGAYLILAARALGLDCGPMSGFNNAKVDEVFFSGTDWKSNFVCNLGYGDPSKLHPRLPRLDFQEACRID